MKQFFYLRAKKIDIATGHPWIVVIHKSDADRYGLQPGDEININWRNKQREAVVDISEKLVKSGQIGLFKDVFNEYKIQEHQLLELSLAGRPKSIKAIQKKLLGEKLSYQEIYSIISDIVNDRLNDVEVGFFVASALAKKITSPIKKCILWLKPWLIPVPCLILVKWSPTNIPSVDYRAIGSRQ